MPGGSKGRNRDHAALKLAAGGSVEEAATAAAVSARTVANWLTEQPFQARVDELRGGMVARAAGKLADAMAEAADVLRALLKSDAEGIRLRAADRLTELGLKVAEVADLQKRLDQLEARFQAREGRR